MTREIELAGETGAPATHRWPLWLYRASTTAMAVLVVAQPALAGQFLSGVYGALGLHSTNANVVAGVSGFAILAAIVVRVAGRGPGWPIAANVLVFALITLQVAAGHNRWIAVHIPLGVAVVLLSLLLVVESWRER